MAGAHAAIYIQDLSGDEACPRRDQVQNGVGYFLRLSDPAERGATNYPAHELLVHRGLSDHFRLDEAGRDGVDRDALLPPLRRELPDQEFDARLAGTVGGEAAPRTALTDDR